MAIAGDTPSLALAFPKPLPAIAHIRESFSNSLWEIRDIAKNPYDKPGLRVAFG
ncbi:hypothetical protein POG22_21350 [Geitlerinema sp. CS-897]|nr:hypothetical protein [Geitlerinema sp. CS-897]